jgi:hypothetical protein
MCLPFTLITNTGSWTLKDRAAGFGGDISDNRIESRVFLFYLGENHSSHISV